MSHSFNKIWIHAIWATKERRPRLSVEIEARVYALITDELKESGCPPIIINGMPDHVHALFLLNPKKSISEVMKQIKGASSYQINQSNLMSEKFAWQTGYAAYSVSESAKQKVIDYIKNQKSHHAKRTFQEEYEDFIRLYGLNT
ncbi:MAG: IS200/IS605 family transposase [Cyclobacteriaceae bacterium]